MKIKNKKLKQIIRNVSPEQRRLYDEYMAACDAQGMCLSIGQRFFLLYQIAAGYVELKRVKMVEVE